MVKKLDELINPPRDPNTHESQELLRELHEKSVAHREKMKKIYDSWAVEDKKNEIN